MGRIFNIILLILVLILMSPSNVYGLEVTKFKIKDYDFRLSFVKKGETVYRAKKRLGAAFVFGGGYFEPSTKKIIDLTIIDGKVLKDYRWDWGRPILIFGKGIAVKTTLDRGQKFTKKVEYALAVDSKPTNPNINYYRQIVAIKNGYIYFVRIKGKETYSRSIMSKWGFAPKDYIYLDGGSSAPKNATIPSRIYVMEPKLKKEALTVK